VKTNDTKRHFELLSGLLHFATKMTKNNKSLRVSRTRNPTFLQKTFYIRQIICLKKANKGLILRKFLLYVAFLSQFLCKYSIRRCGCRHYGVVLQQWTKYCESLAVSLLFR
jgi:hypothetical protein